jgi:hypothetical protein
MAKQLAALLGGGLDLKALAEMLRRPWARHDSCTYYTARGRLA